MTAEKLKERLDTIIWEFAEEKPTPAAIMIIETCLEMASFLCDKNRKYGNSVLSPMRIFSKADTIEQIDVRIDDKLSRLKTAMADDTEDAAKDLLGYLIMRKIALRMEKEAEEGSIN